MASFVYEVETPSEGEGTVRRSLKSGPRVLAKVVERVITRLEERLSTRDGCPAPIALASILNKTWREAYGRPLPTDKEAQQKLKNEQQEKQLFRELVAKRQHLERVARQELAQAPALASATFGAPPPMIAKVPTKASSEPSQNRFKVKGTTGSDGRTKKILLGRKRPRPRNGVTAGNETTVARIEHGSRESGESQEGKVDDGAGTDVSSATQQAASERDAPPRNEDNGTSALVNEDAEGTKDQETAAPEVTVGSGAGRDAGAGAGAGIANELVEGDMDPKKFDFMVTATHLGDRRRTRGMGGWWRFELQAGVIEGREHAFAFDRCRCILDKPQF